MKRSEGSILKVTKSVIANLRYKRFEFYFNKEQKKRNLQQLISVTYDFMQPK